METKAQSVPAETVKKKSKKVTRIKKLPPRLGGTSV